MKKILLLYLIFFHSCITRYDISGIEEFDDIMTVEGIITNDTTIIKLNKSIGLLDIMYKANYINDATVYVECDEGTQYPASGYVKEGTYTIAIGGLKSDCGYRIKIFWDGNEYQSEFLSPLITPEIDSISWHKARTGQPVHICVSTHDNQRYPGYYLWRYNEIWEIHSELFAEAGYLNNKWTIFDWKTPNNIYYCWGYNSSEELLFASSERISENTILEKKIIEINPRLKKLSVLYYVEIEQNSIRKETFDYLTNLQRNIEQTGSIFSPIPYEMKGNITCTSNPEKPAVGYMDVSYTTRKHRFFERSEGLYEPSPETCADSVIERRFLSWGTRPVASIPENYLYFRADSADMTIFYAPNTCLDCTLRGTKKKPDFWPTSNL